MSYCDGSITETMRRINAMMEKHVPAIMRQHGYGVNEIPPPLSARTVRKKHAVPTDAEVIEWVRLYFKEKIGCDEIGYRTGKPTYMIQSAIKQRGFVLRTRKEAAQLRNAA